MENIQGILPAFFIPDLMTVTIRFRKWEHDKVSLHRDNIRPHIIPPSGRAIEQEQESSAYAEIHRLGAVSGLTAGNFSDETCICIFTTFDVSHSARFCLLSSFDSYHESDDKSPTNRSARCSIIFRGTATDTCKCFSQSSCEEGQGEKITIFIA